MLHLPPIAPTESWGPETPPGKQGERVDLLTECALWTVTVLMTWPDASLRQSPAAGRSVPSPVWEALCCLDLPEVEPTQLSARAPARRARRMASVAQGSVRRFQGHRQWPRAEASV